MIHTFQVGGNRFSGRQDKEDLRKALASIFNLKNGFEPASKVKFRIGNIQVSTKAARETTIIEDITFVWLKITIAPRN